MQAANNLIRFPYTREPTLETTLEPVLNGVGGTPPQGFFSLIS